MRFIAAWRPVGPLTSPDGEVILRPWQMDDADFLQTSYADYEAKLRTPLTDPAGNAALRWIFAHQARGLHPPAPAFIISDASGERYGAIGATNIDWAAKRAEFFYWLLAAYRGRGLAARALEAVSRWAESRGLERLELMIDTRNAASRKVAERAGYSFERIHPQHRVITGELVEAASYVRRRRR